jgi:hypothetical protein
MRGAIPPLTPYVFMAWCLVKHRGNFTPRYLYDGNVPSIKLKMSLGRLLSSEATDGLSLGLIIFYVPALTRRLHRGETALHLSENITFLSRDLLHRDTCHQESGPLGFWSYCLYRLSKVGAKTEPYSSPACISRCVESSIETANVLLERIELISFMILVCALTEHHAIKAYWGVEV